MRMVQMAGKATTARLSQQVELGKLLPNANKSVFVLLLINCLFSLVSVVSVCYQIT